MVLAVAGWKTQGDAGLVLFMEDELTTMGWFLGIPVATWGGHPSTFSLNVTSSDLPSRS